jgi:hypothetical protein
LKNDKKIDIRTIMEKRLEKLGIKNDLTEIDKLVSFTKL